jgi:hypothetical protein
LNLLQNPCQKHFPPKPRRLFKRVLVLGKEEFAVRRFLPKANLIAVACP